MNRADHEALAHYAEVVVWIAVAAAAPGIAVLGVLVAFGIRVGLNHLRAKQHA